MLRLLLRALLQSQFLQCRFHLGRVHEQVPQQSAAVVFDHDDDRALIDGEVGFGLPVGGFAEKFAELFYPHAQDQAIADYLRAL